MKRIAVILFALTLSFNSFAQSDDDYVELAREVLKTEKKEAISEILDLKDEEKTPFWDLYKEYQEKLYLIQNKRIALINDFSDNFETLSNEKADELMKNYLSYKSEILKLNKQYYKKFKKVTDVGNAVLLFQAENKIETLIDAQLALEIPMLEVVK